ncbi:MAG: hypothetical protein ABIF92_00090, partial [archaeon]
MKTRIIFCILTAAVLLALLPAAHAFDIESLPMDTYDDYEAALIELGHAYDAGEVNYLQFRIYLNELGANENSLTYVSKNNRADLPWGTERTHATNNVEVRPAIEYQNDVEVVTDYTFARNIYNGTKTHILIEVFDAGRYRADGKKTNAPQDNMYTIIWAFTQYVNKPNLDTEIWNLQRKEYEASFPILEWACEDQFKAKKRFRAIVTSLDRFQLGANKFGGNTVYGALATDSYSSDKCSAEFRETIEKE